VPNSSGRPSDVLLSSDLLEALASVEHERWSHWQRYVHSKCVRGIDGSLTIPAELVARWTAQMDAPYAELSDEEKESDREQVRRYLPLIADSLDKLNLETRTATRRLPS
jgi:hypothetical protein